MTKETLGVLLVLSPFILIALSVLIYGLIFNTKQTLIRVGILLILIVPAIIGAHMIAP